MLRDIGLNVLILSLLSRCFVYRYTSWLCRGLVSATTFTLVGVVNKFLTVLLNVLIWDKHSTPLGLTAVCVCLLAGTFYQQAPRREVSKIVDEVELSGVNDKEENVPLTSKVDDEEAA